MDSEGSNEISKKLLPAKRLERLRPNVWQRFTQLARESGPVVHLGAGFPDESPAPFICDILRDTVADSRVHQATDPQGHPRLIKALSSLYSLLLKRDLQSNEILVTVGAFEALYAVFTSLLNPGDKVMIIEPYLECLESMTVMAGAEPVFATMRPNAQGEWKLNMSELHAKFTKQQIKMMVINTPHNPTGKVFSHEELTEISNICRKHNVIVIVDEAYEWTVFEAKEHVRMASIPDMWNFTITIGSGGKCFGVPGWRIGWLYGPVHLVKPIKQMHCLIVDSCPTPMQDALARVIETQIGVIGKPDSHWGKLRRDLEAKCQRLCSILETAGFRVYRPEAGYFVLADFSSYPGALAALKGSLPSEETDDVRFASWLCVSKKVLTMPSSMFYSRANAHEARRLLRCCFFKRTESLDQAEKNLNFPSFVV